MDQGSILGIISGMALIVVSILLGGDLAQFVNVPGMMIVVGGTIAATFLTFQVAEVADAFRAAKFVFTNKKEDANDIIQSMIDICNISIYLTTSSLSGK